jgi:hypothetical protein
VSATLESQEALVAKLQELIDRQEIHDVLMRYCRACDRADADGIASAFHEDGIDDHGEPRSARELAEGAAAVYMPHMMHFTGNVLIELDGDKAHVESYFISFSSPDEDGTLKTRMRGARYLDRFERRDGVWKIAHRLVVDEWARVDPVTEVPPHIGVHMGIRGPEDPVFHMDEVLR